MNQLLTDGKPRARAVGAILGTLALMAAIGPARAARPVDIYRVSVPAGSLQAETQAAMQQVLVRATGRLDASTDAALAPLVSGAAQYVLSVSSVEDGSVQVVFNGAAVAKEIVAAHRSVWDVDRPFTIVVLTPPPTGAADNEARQSLEQIAEERGLPIALVPLSVTDASGQPLSDRALLNAAERLGGDALLVGRVDATQPTDVWHWTLVTGIASDSWNGTFADGINGATDALARAHGGSIPLGIQAADVAVDGVETLADYAAVEQMLADLPGVQSSGLIEADGAIATFRVLIRGGALAVESALAHSPRLERSGTADAPITYRLHP
jgi:Uncharacterized protein conserved in bacteria (DUF2066)